MAKILSVRKNQKCPICKKPAHADVYPFCSAGCKNIDLNRWLSNAYVVPGRDGEALEAMGDDDPDQHN